MKLLSPLTFCLLFVMNGFSQSFNLKDTIPSDPSVITGSLPNGLTYYIHDNGKAISNMQIRMVVNAGSLLEDDDQRGLAHFMEHMNFNGLQHFPKNELLSYLESNGLKFGADLNASTDADATTYTLWLATEENKKIDKAFLITEDWDHNALLDEGEINQERGVVLEESRLDKNVGSRLRDMYYPTLVNYTKYAERIPIGNDSSIQHFTPEALKRFYKTWYRPDLTAIIVAGDIDPAYIQKEITKHFSDYSNPPYEVAKPAGIVLTARAKDEFLVITDRETPAITFELFGAIEKDSVLKTWGDYRQRIVERLCTQMLNERLKSLTEQNQHGIIAAFAGYGGLIKGYRSFNIRMVIAGSQVKTAVYALVNGLQSVRQNGFLPSELERAKDDYGRSAETERQKKGAESFATACSDHFTEGKPIMSPEGKYLFTKEQLQTITLDELNRSAKTTGSQTGTFTLLMAPENNMGLLPDKEALAVMLAEAKKVPAGIYTEKALSNSLLVTVPEKGSIDRQEKNSMFNTTNWLFKNGISVTLKPTTTKNDVVLMDAWRFGGSHNFGLANKENAEYAARLVQAMGISRFSKPDLDKFLSGKTVSVQPYLNAYEEGIEGKCNAKDLETFLQLIYAYFTAPARDDLLFQSYISRQKGIFQNAGSNPANYFLDSSIRFQYASNPWANTIPATADFDRINLDSSFAIYHRVFSNARGMHFTFVGNFEIDKMKPLLETYLGSLPTAEQKNHFTDEGLRPRKGVAELRVRKGEGKQSLVNLVFTGEAPVLPIETLKLEMLCEIIQRRLMETLREQMGGIYTASVNAAFNKRPYEHYSINIRFPCGPENADTLTQAAISIINDIRENGVEKKYLKDTREMLKGHHAGAEQTNDYWLELLSSAWIDNQDPSWALNFDRDVDGVSAGDLKKTASKYFNMDNYLKMVLLPQ
jgi:zinc protease